jgi:hypothetical protein
MGELQKSLEGHHILWIRKLWEIVPYRKLRDHPKRLIYLSHEVHHGELHPQFRWSPMPIPPVWVVSILFRAIDEADGTLAAMEAMIKSLRASSLHRSVRYSRITLEEKMRIESLRQGLQDQLDFLRSKNVSD